MPRGNPKKSITARVEREVADEALSYTSNMSAAVEEGLRLWLRSVKRKQRTEAKPAKRKD